MNKTDYLKKIIIILSVTILLCFVLLYFIFSFIKEKNQNIYSMKNELSSQTEKSQYVISMEKMIKDTDSDIIRINNSIISKDEDVEFIEKIESMARNNGLELEMDYLSLIDKNIPSPNLEIFKIRASFRGSWTGVYSFLVGIESLPVKVKVERFTITSVPNIDSKNILEWQGLLEINVLKDKQAI